MGRVAAIVTKDSVDLVVPAEVADDAALENLAARGRGRLRFARASEHADGLDARAAAAVDLVRIAGWTEGAVICEISDRAIRPLKGEPLETWADAFGMPVVSWLDIVAATGT